MAVVSAASGNHPQLQENPGCCERIQKALGRLWEWIVEGWHWLTQGVFRVVDGIAFGFFRTLECVSPTLAMRLEAGYGYLTTWYARHTSAVQEKIREKQIGDLEGVNRNLNVRVQETETRATQLEIANAQIIEERNRLKSERDADIQARAEAIGKSSLSKTEKELAIERNQALKQEVVRLRAEQENIIRKQAPILSERDRLQDENKLLKMQKEFADKQTQLLLASAKLIKRIETLRNEEYKY